MTTRSAQGGGTRGRAGVRVSREEVEALRATLPEVLAANFGVADLRRPFHCPDPAHEDRTPSAHYFAAGQVVKCFGCGGSWDVFDLVGMATGIDSFPEQVGVVAELTGRELGRDSPTIVQAKGLQGSPNAPLEAPHAIDVTRACQDAYLRLYTRDGDYARSWLHRRGIDDDQILRCGLGLAVVPTDVAPEFSCVHEPAAVFVSIPYWDASCSHAAYAVLRTVCPRRHIPRRKEWRPKGVASPLWREHLLTSGLEEVLVAEGPIDAIALESRLGLPTMALGGTGLAKRLARVVGETPEELRPRRVLLALDDDKAGHTCASSLAEELWALGVPCAGLPGYAGHKDPDDWLMAECGQTWSYHEEPWPGLRVPRRTIAWAEGEDGEKARNPYDMASVRELARANLRASTRAAS